MQPDPELERQWQERAAELFDSAPAADGARLEGILVSLRTRRTRARCVRRIAWGAAAAAMLGMAAASGAWWLTGESVTPEAEERSEPAVGPHGTEGKRNGAAGDTERQTGTTDDGPVIYRRAQ